jgi:hypothetical protein
MPDDLAMELTGHKSYKIFLNYKSRIGADKRRRLRNCKAVQSKFKKQHFCKFYIG